MRWFTRFVYMPLIGFCALVLISMALAGVILLTGFLITHAIAVPIAALIYFASYSLGKAFE